MKGQEIPYLALARGQPVSGTQTLHQTDEPKATVLSVLAEREPGIHLIRFARPGKLTEQSRKLAGYARYHAKRAQRAVHVDALDGAIRIRLVAAAA